MCKVAGCDRPRKGSDPFCGSHAYRRTRYGDPLARRLPKWGPKCLVQGCERASRVHGMCPMHHARLKKGADLTAPMKHDLPRVGPCLIDGCGKKRQSKGFCSFHYYRFAKYGDPLSEGHRPVGWWKDASGYCYRSVSVGYPGSRQMKNHGSVSETRSIISIHRDEMQKILGRPLVKGENVHHINGIRSDNRPENLELWISYQPSGQRVVDHLSYAREIISRYGDLVEIASLRLPKEKKK